MFGLGLFIAQYGSKIIAGAVILVIRYVEKTATVKHYRKKFDDLLNNNKDENETN